MGEQGGLFCPFPLEESVPQGFLAGLAPVGAGEMMKPKMTFFGMIALLVALGGVWTAAANAQQGQYRGPEDEVRRRPTEESTPSRETVPGLIPGALGGRTGSSGRNPTQTVTRRRVARYDQEGYRRWEFWWEHNKDRYLVHWNLENRNDDDPQYGTPEYYLGKADRSQPGVMFGVSDRERVEKIIPALKLGLLSPDEKVRAASLIALAKTREASVLPLLKRGTADPKPGVRNAAILGLGLLGDLQVVPNLLGILQNTEASTEHRFYAGIALGYVRRSEVTPYLISFLQRHLGVQGQGIGDIQIGVLIGLGVLGDKSAVPLLHLIARDGRLRDDAARAVLYQTLGKLGDLLALPVLLRVLEVGDIQERRSAALALGELDFSPEAEKDLTSLLSRRASWTKKDLLTKVALQEFDRLLSSKLQARRVAEARLKRYRDKASHRLTEVLKSDADGQVRNFAAISIGKIGGDSAKDALLFGLNSGYARSLQAFSALGLGILGDQSVNEVLRKKLISTYGEEDLRGAFALALGLLQDRASANEMMKLLVRPSLQPEFRGYVGLGLGLMGYRDAAPTLVSILRSGGGQEDLLRSATLALGLLGDRDSIDDLRLMIQEGKTSTLRGAGVISQGLLRDFGAVEPMVALLAGKSKSTVKEMAAAALGYLGEREEIPVFSRAAQDYNYRIHSQLMQEFLRLL